MLQIYNALTNLRRGLIASALAAALLLAGPAVADSGFYVGGSVGNTALEFDFEDGGDDFTFDENDFSWKAYGGFKFPVPALHLAVEGGYRSLGGPSTTIASQEFGIDVTAWDVFGVAGFDLGPVTVFGKLGMIAWDAEVTLAGLDAGSEDDQDMGYGLGASFNLGSFQLRAEYEAFDVSDINDLYMLSAGFVYTF